MRPPASTRREGVTGPAARVAALAPLEITAEVASGVHPLRAALDVAHAHPEIAAVYEVAMAHERPDVDQAVAALLSRTTQALASAPFFGRHAASVIIHGAKLPSTMDDTLDEDDDPAPF